MRKINTDIINRDRDILGTVSVPEMDFVSVSEWVIHEIYTELFLFFYFLRLKATPPILSKNLGLDVELIGKFFSITYST